MLPFHKESMSIRNSNILSSIQNLHSMKFETNSEFTTENGGLDDYVLFWDGIFSVAMFASGSECVTLIEMFSTVSTNTKLVFPGQTTTIECWQMLTVNIRLYLWSRRFEKPPVPLHVSDLDMYVIWMESCFKNPALSAYGKYDISPHLDIWRPIPFKKPQKKAHALHIHATSCHYLSV